MIPNAAIDPFAHLHDEAYAARFAGREVGAEGLVVRPDLPLEPLGPWRLTLDLFDEGLRQDWPSLDAAPPDAWDAPRDYDPEAGEPVAVPSCWTCLKPEWTFFEGMGWYATTFEGRARHSGERIVLQVGAASYEARVFLDGQLVGRHRGGSTPFTVKLKGLAPGPHRLLIAVDNRRRPDRVPMNHVDWFNHGGLHREVGLLRLPAVFIRAAGVALVPDGTFRRIRVDLALSDSVDGEAQVTIPDLGVDAAIPVVGGHGEAVIEAEPDLWSPENPRLYDVALAFGADTWRDRVGFREIRTRGREILLNGVALFLCGVCVHEDDARLGRVSTEADVRRRFADARALNANFLRLAHYPHHEHVAQIADEVGFLLWAEVPVYWAIEFDNPDTYADAENQLRELIARDRNRASVISWGVGNENADTDARYRFMADLAAAARAADPTRLVSAACLINRETFRIEDRLAQHLDVIGLNEYFGWYEPDFSSLERLIANSNPDRPVVISETGADALAGHHAVGERVLFTEEWQASFYRHQIAILRDVPYVRGICAWLLYDFRSERRQTRFQRGFNRKGLIAEDKTTRKQAFAVLAELYRVLGEAAAENPSASQ